MKKTECMLGHASLISCLVWRVVTTSQAPISINNLIAGDEAIHKNTVNFLLLLTNRSIDCILSAVDLFGD